MSRVRGFGQWLRAVVLRSRVEDELDEELHDHCERELERQLARGVPRHEAARQTSLRVGSLEATKEYVRDERGGRLISDALADIRIGFRGLRRNRGFATAVVISLALGVAGTTAVSSVVHTVLLRSMPYRDAERLYFLRVWWDSFSAHLSPADIELLRERGGSVGPVAAFFFPAYGFSLTTKSGPEVVQGAFVTSDLTHVLGVSPIVGPGFSNQSDAFEVLIGHDLWQREFGGRSDVIGRTLTFDGRAETVVGVMPPGFTVPGLPDGQAWIKGRWRPPTRRGPFFLFTIVRLRPGLSHERAAIELTNLIAPVMKERFGGNPNWGYGVRSVRDTVVGDSRRTLLLAFGAVGLVLLISILNVANLMLARGTARAREFAVRASIGAGRWRLARQVLTESALLGAFGGALGLALAILALSIFHESAIAIVPRMHELEMNLPVALFALTTGIGAGLLAGVVPVVRMPWTGLADSLRDGGRLGSGGRHHATVRRILVAVEIAGTLTVLTGAALLAKTLHRLESTDPGFTPAGLVSFRLALPADQYPAERRRQFMSDLESQLRTLPRVSAVTFSSALPPANLASLNNYTVEGQTGERGAGVAEQIEVSIDFFETLAIPIVRGRQFDAADRRDAAPVAIVNETFARRQFQALDVLGRRFKSGDPQSKSPWITIVGVAADVPYSNGVWGGAAQTVYTPYAQNLWASSPYIVVKSGEDAGLLVGSIRQAVNDLDPSLPLRDVATMDERLRLSTLPARFRTWLAIALAAIALALAVTGIYGVMAYHVTQRHRETAIRRALGAREGQIIAEVMGSGLRLAGIGIVVGLAGAAAATRSLGTVLYQVSAQDPAMLLAGAAVLGGAALFACLIPAGRAARVDPMLILRDE